jgi:hypothetical protein
MMSLRYQPFGLAEPLCFVDIKASPRVRSAAALAGNDAHLAGQLA